MTHRLSVSRAARLAGVSRAVLQAKISRGDLFTFEGKVSPKDLLRVFPNIDLVSNTEIDRVTRIKENAFGKRIRERVLPNPEVLMSRLRIATQALAISKIKLARIDRIVKNLEVLFLDSTNKTNGANEKISTNALKLIKDFLSEEFNDTGIDKETAPVMAKDELLKIMTGQVTLSPSGKEFFVSGNDSILEAALGAGINLNWGCSNGNCGLCKANLISGKTEKIAHHDFAFSDAEKAGNTILMCCHTPITKIEIEAEELGLSTIPRQKIKCKVKSINRLEPDILELILQTPRSKRLRFFAGQSVSLTAGKNLQRDIPIASCPCDDRNIQFHIRQNDKDEFADYINHTLKPGEFIAIDGPSGEFIYNEELTGSALFIAADTGFAPIQGLIEHTMAVDNAASIELLRIQASSQKPYLDNRCRSWADALDELAYEVVPDLDAADIAIRQLIQEKQPAQIFVAGPTNSLEKLKAGQSLPKQNTKYLAVAPSGYQESN
ncbi:MAG: 2Fe-2S iron-sulfur cluster-binding protein [Acidiferrobacterales bacterium]